MVNKTSLAFAFLFVSVITSSGCVLHNTDSGVCTHKYLPSSSEHEARARALEDMPFCGGWIANYYAPCVPSTPNEAWTAADANFPQGRLVTNDGRVDIHSIRSKDAWINETVTNSIKSRIEFETKQGSSNYHYFRNKDCQDAYARYTCWMNFPRCGDDSESLPLCQSGKV